MALAQAGVTAAVARKAIARLITEEMELPPVALLLRRCREVSCERELSAWRCPECGSRLVAGTLGGPGVCFDCTWEGTLS